MADASNTKQVDEKDKKDEDKAGISSIAKVYLIAYNIIQAGGWGLILFQTLDYILEGGKSIGLKSGVPGLYAKIQSELRLYQTLAFLEVVHCMTGIVPSNTMTTLMQVYSRLFVVWGIIEGVPGTCDCFGLVLAVMAWSVTEIIRYSYYACALIGNVPYIIKYLRYTLFYVLYPTGVLGELMMMFTALPVARASQQWSVILPNPCNMAFSYYYFIIFTIFLYIPTVWSYDGSKEEGTW